MARHIADYRIEGSPDVILNSINQYLMSEGYEYIQFLGENVYKKGIGLLAAPTFFKFSFFNNTLRMETWMKYAVLPGVFVGEIGLTGIWGAAVKGPWKARISYIESMIYHNQPTGMPNSAPIIPPANNAVLNNNPPAPAVGVQQNNSFYCSGCGTMVNANMSFCPCCGKAVTQPK